MNIFLLIIALIACIIALVLYTKFIRQRSQLEKNKQQLDDLEKTLAETQTEHERFLEDIQEQGEFQKLASQIVSHLDHGVICIDEKGIVRLVNTYAEKFLDFSPAAGKSYSKVLQKLKIGGKKDFSQFEQAIKGKSQTFPDTTEFATKQGNVPISAALTPILSDGENSMIAFIFTDNSRNVARIIEEKAFFSAAAHELRTPLSVIRLAVYLLLEEYDNLKREEVIDNLRKIETTTRRLNDLVNDFLNVSRIDLGRLEVDKKPFDVVSLTNEVLKELSGLAREKKLYVEHKVTEGGQKVLGDRIKAKEILTNLISNGIKYTLRGGITVTHKEEKGILLTRVSDTGSGIDKASQGLLFRRFMQVGGGRKQTTAKSTGLGLYISKKFAQLMGGDVVLEESKPNNGSTFTFSLPLE